MRKLTKISTGVLAATAALSLAACGGGAEGETTDEDTQVTDVDPGEGDGTIDDTTVVDATMGAEGDAGMPEDSEEPAGDAASDEGGEDSAEGEEEATEDASE